MPAPRHATTHPLRVSPLLSLARRLHPQALEMFQRFSLTYHLGESFYSNPDHNLMGFVIEEAVYAPLCPKPVTSRFTPCAPAAGPAHCSRAAAVDYGYGGDPPEESSWRAESRERWADRAPPGQRTEMARSFEETMLEKAPDTVLVHFVADAEVIAERMRAEPSEHVSASGGQIMPQVVRAQPQPPLESAFHLFPSRDP